MQRIQLEFKVPILDIVAIVLATVSIIVTVFVAYHVHQIHRHVRTYIDQNGNQVISEDDDDDITNLNSSNQPIVNIV